MMNFYYLIFIVIILIGIGSHDGGQALEIGGYVGFVFGIVYVIFVNLNTKKENRKFLFMGNVHTAYGSYRSNISFLVPLISATTLSLGSLVCHIIVVAIENMHIKSPF